MNHFAILFEHGMVNLDKMKRPFTQNCLYSGYSIKTEVEILNFFASA